MNNIMPLGGPYAEFIFDRDHKQRIEDTQNDFQLESFLWMVSMFLQNRPAILHHNSDIEAVGRHIISEAREVEQELHLNNDLDAFLESLDILFLMGGITTTHPQIGFSEYDAKSQMNGYGNKSGTPDLITEIAGNLDPRQLNRDLTYLAAVVLSQIATMSQPDIEKTLVTLRIKNFLNHVAKFFTDTDPFTGKVLMGDELEVRYQHSRNCLRAIRNFLRDEVKLDVAHGIDRIHWESYEFMIQNYHDADNQLKLLKAQLVLDYADQLKPANISDSQLGLVTVGMLAHV